MFRTFITTVVIATLLSFNLPSSAVAADATKRGLDIAQRADARDTGFDDFTADLIMVLENRSGQKTTRVMRSRTLEMDEDGDRSLVVFESPADVTGTAVLTFSHKSDVDDQWLYLPSIKRVKRIASDNRSGPFMGSEFAYEDLASQEIEKYTYRFIRDETISNIPMHVIERYPTHSKSGYTKQVVWLDRAELRVLRIDYYDRKGALLKTFSAHGFHEYAGRHWRPATMRMVNHQTGKKTTLVWKNYRFKNGLSARDFDQGALKRGT